jgi:hypothetical protein
VGVVVLHDGVRRVLVEVEPVAVAAGAAIVAYDSLCWIVMRSESYAQMPTGPVVAVLLAPLWWATERSMTPSRTEPKDDAVAGRVARRGVAGVVVRGHVVDVDVRVNVDGTGRVERGAEERDAVAIVVERAVGDRDVAVTRRAVEPADRKSVLAVAGDGDVLQRDAALLDVAGRVVEERDAVVGVGARRRRRGSRGRGG